jgi:hypothetical protein
VEELQQNISGRVPDTLEGCWFIVNKDQETGEYVAFEVIRFLDVHNGWQDEHYYLCGEYTIRPQSNTNSSLVYAACDDEPKDCRIKTFEFIIGKQIFNSSEHILNFLSRQMTAAAGGSLESADVAAS